MKVLVIGGAGYVGSPLVYRLWGQGHDVTVYDALNFGGESLVPLLGQPRFSLIRGDIRDSEALRTATMGHDAVCLLAAIVGEPACNRDRDTAVSINLGGAMNVLQIAQECEIPRLVFYSTCSNYGIAGEDDCVNEEALLRPLSTYAETKVKAEEAFLAAANNSFHTTVLRLSTAFGVSPRMRFDLLVSDFALAAVQQNKLVIYGDQYWRPFVHVADVASFTERVLGSDPSRISGQVFNVGDNGNNLRKADLGLLVQKFVDGTQVESVSGSPDPRSYRVDFSKARTQLGFQADWTVAAGVREVVQALRTGAGGIRGTRTITTEPIHDLETSALRR